MNDSLRNRFMQKLKNIFSHKKKYDDRIAVAISKDCKKLNQKIEADINHKNKKLAKDRKYNHVISKAVKKIVNEFNGLYEVDSSSPLEFSVRCTAFPKNARIGDYVFDNVVVEFSGYTAKSQAEFLMDLAISHNTFEVYINNITSHSYHIHDNDFLEKLRADLTKFAVNVKKMQKIALTMEIENE